MPSMKTIMWMIAIPSQHLLIQIRRSLGRGVRVALAFFPKYLAWYLPTKPFGLISGAEPRGSFS